MSTDEKALDLDAIEARANEPVDRMLMLDMIVCDHPERGHAPACRSCDEAQRALASSVGRGNPLTFNVGA